MSVTLKESDCTLTYYRYYLTDKTNYIPIFVVDVPYSSTEFVGIHYFDMDRGDIFGITSLLDKLPVWGEVVAHVDDSTHTTTYSLHYPYLTYEDDLVKIKTEIILEANELYIESKFVNHFNSYGYASLPVPPKPREGDFDSLTISYMFVHFSDDVYTTLTSGTTFECIKNIYHDVIASTSPSEGKKGSITLQGTYIVPQSYGVNYDGKKTDDPYARKLLGKSKKIDTLDPDPNIDDSDGDKNRTPTDDIGGNTIGDDDLPTLSVMDTGLVTLYNPTVAELNSLGHFLWSDAFSVDTFKKLFSDPFDTLLGLSILPVTPRVSGRHNIYFGNIDSGVSCNVVANQFLKVDMGNLTLSETYASAFDYAPSTQVDIYLPFIGSHALNTNDVMGSTLHLIYKFDLLSGGCIAELFINHTSQGNKGSGMKYNKNMGLAYTFSGQCSCSIPLTSNNYNGMIHSIIQSVGTVGAIGASVATGNPALGLASVATSAATIGLQANTPTVQRSGSIGSSNALLSCLTPYLSVQRAHICKPGRFYSKRGIPSQVYIDKISDVGSGNYFQIADCADLHASGASDIELSEIKSILTSGAIW